MISLLSIWIGSRHETTSRRGTSYGAAKIIPDKKAAPVWNIWVPLWQ